MTLITADFVSHILTTQSFLQTQFCNDCSNSLQSCLSLTLEGTTHVRIQGLEPYWPQAIHETIHPASCRGCWHNQTHRLAHFPAHILDLMASLGVEAKVVQELMRHASFRTTMDSYTQALDEPKRQAQKRLADLIMRIGTAGHA